MHCGCARGPGAAGLERHAHTGEQTQYAYQYTVYTERHSPTKHARHTRTPPGDKLVPVSNTLRLAKMLPGSRVAVLKRSGHCPQEEVPEGFEQIVATFLESAVKA